MLWSSPQHERKKKDERDFYPPRLSNNRTVKVIWSSSKPNQDGTTTTELPSIFYPADMLFEEFQPTSPSPLQLAPPSPSHGKALEAIKLFVPETTPVKTSPKEDQASPVPGMLFGLTPSPSTVRHHRPADLASSAQLSSWWLSGGPPSFSPPTPSSSWLDATNDDLLLSGRKRQRGLETKEDSVLKRIQMERVKSKEFEIRLKKMASEGDKKS